MGIGYLDGIEATDEDLEHYGRLGMKWYQHRFGEVDGRAKYKEKYGDKADAYLLKKIQKAEKYKGQIEKKIEKRKTKSRENQQKKIENVLDWMNKASFEDIINMRADDIKYGHDLIYESKYGSQDLSDFTRESLERMSRDHIQNLHNRFAVEAPQIHNQMFYGHY